MQEHNYSIKQWAKDDRPREKLRLTGAENLSNSELLAILIQKGTREKSAVDLAKEVLRMGKNSLSGLGKLTMQEFMKIKGIGEAKAISIVAALELGRRSASSSPELKPVMTSSSDIARFLQSKLRDQRRELFGVLFLNRSNRLNHFEIVSEGGITGTVADPRIILRKALEEDAVNLVLCHNHPSGSLKPSRADEQLTTKIKEAASYFDIKVLDHIIISDDGYFSFADEGMI
jgi:DNA repair protein RadC